MNNHNTQPENPSPDASASKHEHRSWIRYIVGGVLLTALVLAGFIFLPRNDTSPEAGEADSLNFAEVVITDLVQEETIDGTIGTIAADPVKTQREGTITDLPDPGERIHQGEALFSINNQPTLLLYGDIPAFRDFTIGEDTVMVASQPGGTVTWLPDPGTVILEGDVLYQHNNRPVLALYGDQPAYRDLGIVSTSSAAEDEITTITGQPSGTITGVREPGTLIEQGEALYYVDGQPVILLYGEQPSYRSLFDYDPKVANGQTSQESYNNKPLSYDEGPNLIGDDVLQLEEALVSLGYDPGGYVEIDKEFTFATRHMVKQWQRDVSLDVDGVVHFGEVVFLPGPVRVLENIVTPGDPTGGPVMHITAGSPTSGADVRQLEEALLSLGYDAEGALVADDTFTAETTQAILELQAAVGLKQDGILHLGEVVFLPGPAQVLDHLVVPGNPSGGGILHVATGEPASGGDVLQLEEALLALGYDAEGGLVADGTFTTKTVQAVREFQGAVGLEQDGILHQGEVAFLPGTIRVTDQMVTKGSYVGVGSPILGVSLSEKVVRVDLSAKDQDLLSVGDAVTVEMPDATEVPATVTFISQTATPSPDGYSPPTFEVRIAFDDPTAAEGLDEAPVDVKVVSDTVEDVMAVPVSALLALLEGGYAVEVDQGNGQVQLTAVEVGFFSSDNMIEIVSGDLEAGDRVVVP
jgi:peptidoglycan hydrolase-like protein with peptidoglycan-binding domain